MIDRKTFFDQRVKNDQRTYDNVKQQALGADPNAIQQINFTGNIN